MAHLILSIKRSIAYPFKTVWSQSTILPLYLLFPLGPVRYSSPVRGSGSWIDLFDWESAPVISGRYPLAQFFNFCSRSVATLNFHHVFIPLWIFFIRWMIMYFGAWRLLSAQTAPSSGNMRSLSKIDIGLPRGHSYLHAHLLALLSQMKHCLLLPLFLLAWCPCSQTHRLLSGSPFHLLQSVFSCLLWTSDRSLLALSSLLLVGSCWFSLYPICFLVQRSRGRSSHIFLLTKIPSCNSSKLQDKKEFRLDNAGTSYLAFLKSRFRRDGIDCEFHLILGLTSTSIGCDCPLSFSDEIMSTSSTSSLSSFRPAGPPMVVLGASRWAV